MNDILATGHTWFLESYRQGPYGDLVIRVVEGIKGTERMPVSVGERTLGPYLPVTVGPESRCALIRFQDVRAVFTFPESYDCAGLGVKLRDGEFVRGVEDSEFRHFAGKTTTAVEEYKGAFSEWLVWTEDQLFQVISGTPPEIVLDDAPADLTIERGQTWSAS